MKNRYIIKPNIPTEEDEAISHMFSDAHKHTVQCLYESSPFISSTMDEENILSYFLSFFFLHDAIASVLGMMTGKIQSCDADQRAELRGKSYGLLDKNPIVF